MIKLADIQKNPNTTATLAIVFIYILSTMNNRTILFSPVATIL